MNDQLILLCAFTKFALIPINSFTAENFFLKTRQKNAQIDNRTTEVACGSESILSTFVTNGMEPGGQL